MFSKKSLYLVVAAATSSLFTGTVSAQTDSQAQLEEILVLGESSSYANATVSQSMADIETGMTSVLAVIDQVPGVLITEGDVLGSDDWSTTVSIRGFSLNLDEQQIGMTVDGIPNGNSNYGGGSKANRFIDTQNLATVEVSQGTADIASRSHEALGGTLNFITEDPLAEERLRVSLISGDYNASKYYVRYDTGEFAANTRAWVSLSSMRANAWIDESGESTRTHAAIKTVTQLDTGQITGYIAYDDTAEDNYQRVTAEEFEQNPDWDRLTGDWTGIPLIDQMYRRGWSTLRENLLAYVKFDFDFTDSLHLQVAPYYHQNEGRGDWLPQYVVDVTDDGAGEPQSELEHGNTVRGGPFLGRITYVDRGGVALTPATDCSSLTFPYGGTSNDNPDSLIYDPACFPADAIPVGSFRHTHYEKERIGLTADIDWRVDFALGENLLRAGLWYEDYHRQEWRDWHKVIDSRTAYHFDHTPYWVQYDREYPAETTMLYLEDTLTLGPVDLRVGGKQWFVDIDRQDNIAGGSANFGIDSDSDFLLSAGVLWRIDDMFEAFAGYAENFAAVKDEVLEAAGEADALEDVEPETAENYDVGVRMNADTLTASATYYKIDFENRITYIPALDEGGTGNEYLDTLGGTYQNVGGIESEGYELAATWAIRDYLHLYVSYTDNESLYLDFGDRAGNTVFGSVEDMYVVSLDWYRGPYTFGFSNKHVGERWMDPENEVRIDAYDVADVYVQVNGDAIGVLKGFDIKLTMNNVFDEDYLGGTSGGWGAWIGGGRYAALTLTGDF